MRVGRLTEVQDGLYLKKVRKDKPYGNQHKKLVKELRQDYSYVVIDQPDAARHNGYYDLIKDIPCDYKKYNLLVIKTGAFS